MSASVPSLPTSRSTSSPDSRDTRRARSLTSSFEARSSPTRRRYARIVRSDVGEKRSIGSVARRRLAAANESRGIRRRTRSRARAPSAASSRSAACARRRRSSTPCRRSCRTRRSTGRRGNEARPCVRARRRDFEWRRARRVMRRVVAIGCADRIEPAEIDDHAVADRAARHAAARRARHERDVFAARPAHERGDVVGACWARPLRGHNAADAGRLGVDGASRDVVAERSAEVAAGCVEQPSSSGLVRIRAL